MKRILFTVFICLSGNLLAQTSVNKTENLLIGGIRQFVSIKGKDNSKPLLLFLHGGPGGSVMSYASKFSRELEKHFVVVHWDQRETGKTKDLNTSPVPLTFDLFINDTHELIDTLLNRYHHTKMYLVGHSWGTAIGLQMAKLHPKKISAFISIGTMIDQLESERIALDSMINVAKKNINSTAIKELSGIHIPFENGEQLYFHRKWLLQLMGSKTNLSRDYVLDWAETWLKVFNEASSVCTSDRLDQLDCPVYFFAGRKDIQTNSLIAERFYQRLKAPVKEFYWFEKSAHGIPTTEPARVQEMIITKILKDNP